MIFLVLQCLEAFASPLGSTEVVNANVPTALPKETIKSMGRLGVQRPAPSLPADARKLSDTAKGTISTCIDSCTRAEQLIHELEQKVNVMAATIAHLQRFGKYGTSDEYILLGEFRDSRSHPSGCSSNQQREFDETFKEDLIERIDKHFHRERLNRCNRSTQTPWKEVRCDLEEIVWSPCKQFDERYQCQGEQFSSYVSKRARNQCSYRGNQRRECGLCATGSSDVPHVYDVVLGV
jgi:hypothetical protein